jgi:hypothetical protein
VSVPHHPHAKQAQILPGTTPGAPGTTDTAPGTIQAAGAMVPPLTPAPIATEGALAFSRPCPRCRATVSLPWCPILSAVLDRIDVLETGYREDLPGEIAVLHARRLWLEAALRALQASDEEGQS